MLETRTSLLERVRDQADVDAWREFVSLYRPLLLGYVKSQGVQPADAEDIVQGVFLTLLRSLSSFNLDRRRGRFRSWLWQVTMNDIHDHHRRKASRRRVEDHVRETAPVALQNTEPDPEWVRAHRERVLEHVLPLVRAETQEKTWVCFEEHILKGRRGPEVAEELGMKPNTVLTNAARVLRRVRERCAEYQEDLGDETSSVPG